MISIMHCYILNTVCFLVLPPRGALWLSNAGCREFRVYSGAVVLTCCPVSPLSHSNVLLYLYYCLVVLNNMSIED